MRLSIKELNNRLKTIERQQKELGYDTEIYIICQTDEGLYYSSEEPSRTFNDLESLQMFFEKDNRKNIFVVDAWA